VSDDEAGQQGGSSSSDSEDEGNQGGSQGGKGQPLRPFLRLSKAQVACTPPSSATLDYLVYADACKSEGVLQCSVSKWLPRLA
jgi:hypothetical protein